MNAKKYKVKDTTQSYSVREVDREKLSAVLSQAHDVQPVRISKNSKDYVVIVNYDEYLKLINLIKE